MMEKMIPMPKMSDYLIEEFMKPLNIDVRTVSRGTGIPLSELELLLKDEEEMTPDQSRKLGGYFGVSDMLFYDIQQDLKVRAGVLEFEYA